MVLQYNLFSYIIYNLRNFLRNFLILELGVLVPYIERRLVLLEIAKKSFTPRIQECLTPGKSLAPTPQTKTAECFLKVCPIPGKCATTFLLLIKIILATGLRAEFGFFGVAIRTRITVPRTCGFPCKIFTHLDLFFNTNNIELKLNY